MSHDADGTRGHTNPSVQDTGEGVEPMGRGRAKAKQTKVARRLKYSGPDTDLQRLEAELTGRTDSGEPSDPPEDDPYPDSDIAQESSPH